MTRAIRLPLCLVLLLMGCASAPPAIDRPTSRPVAGASIRFGVDTFAFANEIRWKNPDKTELYANYCFVMARAVTQFNRFARFDPAAPKLSADGYEERVARVVSHAPWDAPLPPDERVVIPGYPSLNELSREEEYAVKAGLGSPFWTWVHWTNWRVTFPVTGAQQEGVAAETLAELQAGRLVQLLVTNLPTVELNHTVIAYGYRVYDGRFLELVVYDPNDPARPGAIAFDRLERRFFASDVYDTSPGDIRAFRMYFSPLL